jgi:hypothetical protein
LGASHIPTRSEIQRLYGFQQFHFLIANRFGVERHRWLHRSQREQLHRVILNHVAERSTLLVVPAAGAYADFFRYRDLNAVDEVAVPQRLEDRVGESLHQQVLHGFLAEVVIDAIHLMFFENVPNRGVERTSRCQIFAKRFLDDDFRVM